MHAWASRYSKLEEWERCVCKTIREHTVLIQSHNTGHEWNPCTIGLLFPPAALNLLCVWLDQVDIILYITIQVHTLYCSHPVSIRRGTPTLLGCC